MVAAAKQIGGGGQRKSPRQGIANRKFKTGPINGIVAKIPGRMLPIMPRFNAYNAMFSASQIPDNPGYLDFNEPTPQPRNQQLPQQSKNVNKQSNPGKAAQRGGGRGGGGQQRHANQSSGGAGRRIQPPRNQNANGWGGQRGRGGGGQMPQQLPLSAQMLPAGPSRHGSAGGGGGNGRNFPTPPMGRMGGRPPLGMRPPPMIGPPPLPPPNMGPAGRFGGPRPRPLIPPSIAGCPPPLGPPPIGGHMRPLRGSGGGPMPPRPLMQRGGGPLVGGLNSTSGGPMRRPKSLPNNNRGKNNNNNQRARKQTRGGMAAALAAPGNGANMKPKKSTTTKKTLIEIINQYPITKPWVTDEIREEHRKKEDIENRLKGNKNDQLFAEFKVQRDKFVKMYETARLEFIGKHPEQDIDKILTESSGKGEKAKTNANANQKTIEKSAAT